MIGYDRLGTNGRFGNQLFQYAALRGIAAHHGYDWCIPPDDHATYANYGMHHPFKLKNLTEKNIGFVNSNVTPQAMFSYENIKGLNSTSNVKESVYYFDKDLFENFEDGSNLDGFCQTEKYFKHIEDEIREDFAFKDEVLEPCNEFISSFENILFLHVRRGDNVGREDYYRIMTFDYYESALAKFDDDAYVLVCSDDTEWCPYTDLCLMSLCDGAILSSSTLGWWGAWLQKGRTNPVVVPEHWYGPTLEEVNDCRDLYPEEWTVIPN